MHFLVLGALVFALYNLMNPDELADDEIIVTRGQQEHLLATFTRAWQRPPTHTEFSGIVDDWVREEIAYREGRRLNLDEDDTIIRRRLRQKFEALADDVVSMAEPSEEMLQQYLSDNVQNYTHSPAYSLRQVFFDVDERGSAAQQDAEQALLLLANGSPLINPETMGDFTTLPHSLSGKTAAELAATFGGEFATGLADLEAGSWHGPLLSGFGLHLVYIDAITPGRPMTLEEAGRELQLDWDNEQRTRAIDALYEQLGSDYVITIEPMTLENPEP